MRLSAEQTVFFQPGRVFQADQRGERGTVQMRNIAYNRSGFTFGKIERQNCFEDGTVNTLYFPVMDSDGFPKGNRNS